MIRRKSRHFRLFLYDSQFFLFSLFNDGFNDPLGILSCRMVVMCICEILVFLNSGDRRNAYHNMTANCRIGAFVGKTLK